MLTFSSRPLIAVVALLAISMQASLAHTPVYIGVNSQTPKVNGVHTTDYENVGDMLTIYDVMGYNNIGGYTVNITSTSIWEDAYGDVLNVDSNTLDIPPGQNAFVLTDSHAATSTPEHYHFAEYTVTSNGEFLNYSQTDFAMW